MKLIILLLALVLGFNYALQDAVKNIQYPKAPNLYLVQTELAPQLSYVEVPTGNLVTTTARLGLNY